MVGGSAGKTYANFLRIIIINVLGDIIDALGHGVS